VHQLQPGVNTGFKEVDVILLLSRSPRFLLNLGTSFVFFLFFSLFKILVDESMAALEFY
jgi:hypothetical protein